ncbi:MAG: hypothetical protein LLF78_00160 [Synergistaceae bacterium]|nr:hypothetical protein [Synergistaceae bacterium]
MTDLFYLILKYFYAGLLMCATILSAVFAESLYYYLLYILKRNSQSSVKAVASPLVLIRRAFSGTVILPETACAGLALYGPALAFAAFLPVCASIPFCTVVPILDNGSDIMQILQFFLTSEALSVLTIYSLGSPSANKSAFRLMKELACFMLPLIAFVASVSWYFNMAAPEVDAFSLNSFSVLLQGTAIGWWGTAGIILFIFIIISQIPHSGPLMGCALFDEGELVEYQGCQRAIMQIWAVFRAYIIIAVITHIFFPWNYFKTLDTSGSGISWWFQVFNFVVFWFVVIIVRVFVCPVCWKLTEMFERKIPCYARIMLFPVLTAAAMVLVYYEAVKLSLEAAAF